MADTRDFLLDEIKHALEEVIRFLSVTLKKEKLKKDVSARKDELTQEISALINRVEKALPQEEQEEYADVEIDSSQHAPPPEIEDELYEDTAVPDSPNKNVMSQGSNHDNLEEPEPPEASERDENGEPYGDMKVGPIAATDLTKPTMEGFLDKRRKEGQIGLDKWQRRYCVIKENIFYYFKNRNDKQQKNVIILNGYEARPNPDYDKKHKRKDFLFEVVCPIKRSFQFVASSTEEMRAWIDAVTRASRVIPAVDSSPKPEPRGSLPVKDIIEPEPIEEDFDETYDDVDTYQQSKAAAPPPIEPDDSGEIYDDTGLEIIDTDEVYEDVSSDKPEVQRIPPRPPHTSLPQVPHAPLPSHQPSMKLPAIPIPNRPKPEPPSRQSDDKPTPPQRGSDEKSALIAEDFPPPPSPLLSARPEPWEEDYKNVYVGMWDCTADEDNELSFKRGDLVHILSKEYASYNWWVGEKNSKVGLVPKDYLMEAYDII